MSHFLSIYIAFLYVLISPLSLPFESCNWIGLERLSFKDFHMLPVDCFFEVTRKKRVPLTVSGAISKYGHGARKNLVAKFAKANLTYPPKKLVLIGLKQEEKLLIYAKCDEEAKSEAKSETKSKANTKAKAKASYCKVMEYPILGTSGVAGPKLEEGDCQMPEGFYKISAFNPNSRFHLSLRVNYPNKEDRANAKIDKRTNLGGDIMIHGSDCSIGCLAMGDSEIEEIFTLVYDTGRGATRVILAPCDLTQSKPIIDMKKQPKWLPGLYKRLKASLKTYMVNEI